MADQKISQLTDGTSFQAGDEAVVNRSGTNYKVDPTQFGSSIDVTGTVTAEQLNIGDGQAQTHLIQAYKQGTTPVSFGLGEQPNTARALRLEKVDEADSDPYAVNFYFSDSPTSEVGSLNFFASQEKLKILRLANNGDISFYEDTGTTPKFFWDASAEALGIGTTSPGAKLDVNGNIIAGGVYLGGTGAANLLDDYEEGVFTPVFADASTGGTSVNGDYGYYTKVGDMVTVHFAIINMDTSGMTAGNAVYFRGLPFTSATISGPGFFLGSTRTSLVTSTANPTASVAEEATYGTFHDGGSILVLDVTSGSGDFYVTVTYRAA